MEADDDLAAKVNVSNDFNEIEYRRGSAGGGNQLRQPYLRPYVSDPMAHKKFPITDHIHFYGYYIGNFPDLKHEDVDLFCDVLNNA